jgi:DNA-binding CsgD family transcriptional regulator
MEEVPSRQPVSRFKYLKRHLAPKAVLHEMPQNMLDPSTGHASLRGRNARMGLPRQSNPSNPASGAAGRVSGEYRLLEGARCLVVAASFAAGEEPMRALTAQGAIATRVASVVDLQEELASSAWDLIVFSLGSDSRTVMNARHVVACSRSRHARAAFEGDEAPARPSAVDDALVGMCERVLMRTGDVSERIETFARAHGLTPRKREILPLLVAGMDPKNIASRIGISHGTVRVHLTELYERCNVRDRTGLLVEFWRT